MGCSRIFPLINRQLETQLESSIILPGILELARGFFHVALSENSAPPSPLKFFFNHVPYENSNLEL